MSEADRIDAVIAALEALVETETRRRGEREKQRELLRTKIVNSPAELERQLPAFNTSKVEAQAEARRQESEKRMSDALKREQELLAFHQRQVELLEAILVKLESKK